MKLLRTLCCAAVVLLVASPGFAQEPDKKAADAPKGTYKRTAGDFTLTFDFNKENMFTFKMVDAGGNGMTFDAEYKKGDDGKVTATVKSQKTIGTFEGGPSEGDEYTFKVKFDGEKMTFTDLKGPGDTDVEPEAKQLVEGVYTRADD